MLTCKRGSPPPLALANVIKCSPFSTAFHRSDCELFGNTLGDAEKD